MKRGYRREFWNLRETKRQEDGESFILRNFRIYGQIFKVILRGWDVGRRGLIIHV